MGSFSVKVTVVHPTDPERLEEVELIVDTGVTLSWIPREIIEKLRAPRLSRRSFLIADGRTIERETATAIVRYNGTSGGVTVVVAEPGDGHLLGATSLETLGLGVDPIRQRLVSHTLLAM